MPEASSKRRVKRRKPRLVLILSGLLIFLILAGIFWGERVKPLVLQFAEARCKVLLTDMVNQAIADRMSEEGLSGFDVMQFEKDDSGSVVAMQVDTISVNQIKSVISLAVSESLSDTETDGFGLFHSTWQFDRSGMAFWSWPAHPLPCDL